MSYEKGSLDDHIKEEVILNWVKRYEEMLLKNEVSFFEQDIYGYLIEYYDENLEYEKAYALIEHAIEQHPYTVEFQIKKAQFLFEHSEAQDALDLLNQVRIFHPSDLEVFLLEVEILLSCRQYKQARNELYQALQIADIEEKVDIYLTLANVYEHWGKKEAAFRSIHQALVLIPNHEDALNHMAYFVEANQKYSESIILHQQIIEQDPYAYLAWYNLGQAFMGLGLYQQAIEAYDFVMVIEDQFQAAYASTARAYYQLEDYSTALSYYQEALLIDEPDEEIYTDMGLCYFQLEQLSQAINHFTAAIHIDDTHHKAFYHLGKCYEWSQYVNKAASYYQRALYLSSDDFTYLIALGDIWQKLGYIDKAAILYQEFLERHPYHWDCWTYLLRLMCTNDQKAEMIQLIDAFYFRYNFATHTEGQCLRAIGLWVNAHQQESLVLFNQALPKNKNCKSLILAILPENLIFGDLVCVLI